MTTPAGWYPDPEQPGQQRYWDGTRWTEHRSPVQPTPPPPAPPPPAAPTPLAATPQSAAAPQGHYATVQPNPSSGRTGKIVLIVVGVIIGLLIVSGVIDSFSSEDEVATTATPTESPTESKSEEPDEEEPLTFKEWAATEGQKYVPFSSRIARLGRQGAQASADLDIAAVSRVCRDFAVAGQDGLELPDAPSNRFNQAWDSAMRQYIRAGTYASAIKDFDADAVEGCGNAISRATVQVQKATALLKRL